VGAQLLDRHHESMPPPKGVKRDGVDEWFVGFDADSTLDRDVAQWELITIRELASPSESAALKSRRP